MSELENGTIGGVPYDQVKNIIETLLDHHDMPLNKISNNPKLLEMYQKLLATNKKLEIDNYPEPEINSLKHILKTQYIPVIISENTIGSFIYGCFYQYHGNIDKKCSPYCINGMQLGRYEPCEYQIWVKKGVDIEWVNPRRNPPLGAYVYLDVDDKISGLTLENIEILKSNRVLNVTFYTRDSASFYKSSSSMSIDEVIPYKSIDDDSSITYTNLNKKYKNDDYDDDETSSDNWIAILVLLFIFVVIAIILRWCSGNMSNIFSSKNLYTRPRSYGSYYY